MLSARSSLVVVAVWCLAYQFRWATRLPVPAIVSPCDSSRRGGGNVGVEMKRELGLLLAEGRLDEVARLARQKTRVLGALVPFTYKPDPRAAWQAVEAMGRAAAAVAETSPEAVREHLRRLLWLISEESGGLCWRSPEAMAEIVRRAPLVGRDYIPIIVNLLVEMAEEDLAHFRGGILWAIGRLGPLAREAVADVLPQVTAALVHPDPRGSRQCRVGARGVRPRPPARRPSSTPARQWSGGPVPGRAARAHQRSRPHGPCPSGQRTGGTIVSYAR